MQPPYSLVRREVEQEILPKTGASVLERMSRIIILLM